MLVFETQFLEFGFDPVQSQTVGKRSVQIHGFAGNFVLFAWRQGAQGPHVVQAVGHFYQDYPDVFGHGQEQSPEIFGLSGSVLPKDSSGDLCQTFHYGGNSVVEVVSDVFDGKLSVFYHVVQKSGTDRGGTQTDFGATDAGYGQRMHYIRLSRAAFDTSMGIVSKLKCLGNQIHFFAMV